MKRTALVSLVLLGTLGLAGCSAGSMGASDSGGYPMPESAEQADGDLAATDYGVSQDSVQSEPQVVTTGSITVLADDPIEAAAEAIRIVEGADGRVDSREEYAAADTDKGSATLVLRIPAKAQSTTIVKLRGLGEVQDVQISSSDVTAEVADLEGRITALQASVDRLTTLLATASNTDSLVSIESSLSSRQAELESLQSQQRALGDKVAMSTITLRLISEPLPPKEDEPNTFFTGLTAGWESFAGFIVGLTVVFGALLPWLVFLAILGAIALGVYRWRRSKRPVVVAGTTATETTSAPPTA